MDEIYKKYSKFVYNYLCRLTNDRDLSEELTQETFYSAIKGINRFENKCSIRVWLCQIANNKWKDFLRKNKKHSMIALDVDTEYELSENASSFEDFISSREEVVMLYKKIHSLDEKIREVFYLKLLGDLTFKEIGKIIGKSEQWARSVFYRGKEKLKEDFKNEQKL